MTIAPEAFTASVEDARRLLAWAEPNRAVYEDPTVEDVVLCVPQSSTGATHPLAHWTTPMLRFADPDIPPVALVDIAVFGLPRTKTRLCEGCGSNAGGKHRLIVPKLPSYVAIHVCFFCRELLLDISTDLVWG